MIDQVSYSSIALWLKCPKLWEYKYVHDAKLRYRSLSMLFGSCYHKTLQANYRHKMNSHVDLPIDAVLAAFKKESKRQFGVSPPTIEPPIEEIISLKAQYFNVGNSLLRKYMGTVAPLIQPMEVEKRHHSKIAGIEFVVIPDLITTSGIVIDHKTTTDIKYYRSGKADADPQPSACAMCLDKQIVFHFHVAVTGLVRRGEPQEPCIHVVKTLRLRKQMEFWLKMAEKAVLDMNSGNPQLPVKPNCKLGGKGTDITCRGYRGCSEKERILQGREIKWRNCTMDY